MFLEIKFFGASLYSSLLKHEDLTEQNVPLRQVKSSFHVDLDGFCNSEGTRDPGAARCYAGSASQAWQSRGQCVLPALLASTELGFQWNTSNLELALCNLRCSRWGLSGGESPFPWLTPRSTARGGAARLCSQREGSASHASAQNVKESTQLSGL